MTRKITLAAVAILALSGCGSSGLLDRNRPDEFAVTRAAPLAIPSEFTLPAPQEGAPRPQDSDTKKQMLDAMFGTSAPSS
jgi:uncharacterized lipoprotein